MPSKVFINRVAVKEFALRSHHKRSWCVYCHVVTSFKQSSTCKQDCLVVASGIEGREEKFKSRNCQTLVGSMRAGKRETYVYCSVPVWLFFLLIYLCTSLHFVAAQRTLLQLLLLLLLVATC